MPIRDYNKRHSSYSSLDSRKIIPSAWLCMTHRKWITFIVPWLIPQPMPNPLSILYCWIQIESKIESVRIDDIGMILNFLLSIQLDRYKNGSRTGIKCSKNC